MADNVARIPILTTTTINLGEGAAAGTGGFVVSPRKPKPSPPDAASYRLTIEEGPDGFVYKTRDRVTNEVIRQLPRETVLELKDSPAYGKGEVFDTNA